MEEAKDYKKYLKGLKEATKKSGRRKGSKKPSIQGLLAARNLLKRNKGGAMLKNPGKADLDKDGKLSGYEKKRGMAIEKSMSGKPMKAAMGKSVRGYGAARTSGMGLQDEAMKPGKVMMANKGKEVKEGVASKARTKVLPEKKARLETNFGKNVNPKRADRLRAKREKFIKDIKSFGRKAAKSIVPGAIAASGIKQISKLIPKKNKGGGADMSTKMSDTRKKKIAEILSRLKKPRTINIKKSFTSGTSNPMQRDRKREGYRAKVESAGGKVMFGDERGMKKFKKFMGGGMMKPMGYSKGASIMARGCKLGRKKATKLS